MRINLDHITLQKSSRKIFDNLSLDLDLHDSKTIALTGANGAGKTTLLNIISGFQSFDAGEYRINDRAIAPCPQTAFSHGICRTFQTPRVFESLSIDENIHIANHQNTKDLEIIFQKLGFAKGKFPQTKFEKTHFEIVRCMISKPKLILLDEPLAGLFDDDRRRMIKILKTLQAQDVSLLIIEHDHGFLDCFCDVTLRIDSGKIAV